MTESVARLTRLGIAALGQGIWRIALPFDSPLVYSFAYVVRGADGVIVIDLGADSDESWQTFRSGLRHAGVALSEIVGVVVTHAHPDHIGLANRLKAVTDAWIAVHPAEASLLARGPEEQLRRVRELEQWLRDCDAPAQVRTDFDDEAREVAFAIPRVMPDRALVHGDTVPGTSESLVAIHTPGHTAGHLCFHDRERRLLFTGDHVLPRVTPNVSKRPGSGENPLADYHGSVGEVARLNVDLVLPGHEWSFDRLDMRIQELGEHHEARLDEVEQAVRAGASTAWEIAASVQWSRPLTSLNGRGIRSALGVNRPGFDAASFLAKDAGHAQEVPDGPAGTCDQDGC